MDITSIITKSTFFTFLCVGITSTCYTQSSNTKPFNLLQKGKIEKAAKDAQNLLDKDQGNALAYYVLSETSFQLDSQNYLAAYNLACLSQTSYRNSDEEDQKEKWEKAGFTSKLIRGIINKLCHYAALEVELRKSIEMCLSFRAIYKNAQPEDLNRVDSLLYELAFTEASQKNTVESWNHYIQTLPLSPRISEAYTHKEKAAFDRAEKLNTIDAWIAFIRNNPNSNNRAEAKRNLESLEFTVAVGINSISEYERFILTYPSSEKLLEIKEYRDDLELGRALSSHTIFDLKEFKKRRPNSYLRLKTDSILSELEYVVYVDYPTLFRLKNFILNYPNGKKYSEMLFELITRAEQSNSMELILYAASVPNLKMEDEIALIEGGIRIRSKRGEVSDLDLLEQELSILLSKHVGHANSIIELRRLINVTPEYLNPCKDEFRTHYAQPNHDFSLAERMYLRSYHAFIEYRKELFELNEINDLSTLRLTKSYDLNNWWISELLRIYEEPIAFSRTIKGQLNTSLGEYVPTPTSDGKTMYYCQNDTHTENIYMSKHEMEEWGPGEKVYDLSTDNSNDAPLNISTDGMELIIFKSGEIMKSEKTASGWSEPDIISELNIGTWNAGAQLVSTKEAMIFTSLISDDEPHKDIFVALLTREGEISEPINIGPVINTSGNDRTPFLHPDMKTLYFSSNGHGGLGEMDVFMSKRLNDSCWTCWSTPINLGRGVNSKLTDWGFKISTDGTTAYYAQKNPGYDNDLFEIKLSKEMRPDVVATIEGRIVDKYNQPVEAKIIWENLETEEIIGEAKTDPVDGSYFIVLPTGNVYGYFVEMDGFYPTSSSIDLTNQTHFTSISEDIEMVFTEDVLDGLEDAKIPINNIFFSTGSDELLSISNSELKRLAEFIKTYNRSVVISGHTDDIGSNERNQSLSEQRANSVKEALIDLGCDAEQLNTIGYGELKPVVSNNTRAGRKKNRRVELTFAD